MINQFNWQKIIKSNLDMMNGALPHAPIREEEQEVADFLAAAEAADKCSGIVF